MSNQSRLPMPADATQVHGLTLQTWKVLTEVIFPSAKTPEAIMMALDYCQARKLDIFKRPVHVVPMWSSSLRREVETVWPSIQEIQTTASRTGLWAGMDSPKWGPDIKRTFKGSYKDGDSKWQETTLEVTFPEWCEVTVYKLVDGKVYPFCEPVYWEEIYSTRGKSELPTPMWIKRPRGQLHKCAKAASLRAAFPEECGEYVAEEMADKVIDDASDSTVIEGSATRAEPESAPASSRPQGKPEATPPAAPKAVDPASIGEGVKKKAKTLVDRVTKTGAWSAAEEWARSNFVAEDLDYVLSELSKAKAEAEGQNTQPPKPESAAEKALKQAKAAVSEEHGEGLMNAA